MESLQKTIEFLSHLSWPVTVLVIVVIFRNPISKIIERVMKLNVEAGKFKLQTVMREYVPANVLSELTRNPSQINFNGEMRRVTILYSQTRGFTDLSERLSPESVANYIRTYLTQMTEIIFQLGGTLDRYEGTAFTAYWGAPIPYDDSPARACEAALRMYEAIKILSPRLEQEGYPPLLPIIAITTAQVLVGDFGSEQRFSYSILGDYDHILKGLARMNYSFRTSILMTQYTVQEVENRFEMRLLAEGIHLKGKAAPIDVYELLAKK